MRRLLVTVFRIWHSQAVGDPHSGGILSFHIRLEFVTQEIVTKTDIVPLRGHPEVAGILLQPFVIAGRQRVKILAIQVAVLQFSASTFCTRRRFWPCPHQSGKQVQTKQEPAGVRRDEEILCEVVLHRNPTLALRLASRFHEPRIHQMLPLRRK